YSCNTFSTEAKSSHRERTVPCLLAQWHSFCLLCVVVLDPILCEALHHKTSFVCEELTWAELLERSVMLYSCSVV
ncbi:hypothetical protein GBAR_LOCUS19933, partial [Geodia barretti]